MWYAQKFKTNCDALNKQIKGFHCPSARSPMITCWGIIGPLEKSEERKKESGFLGLREPSPVERRREQELTQWTQSIVSQDLSAKNAQKKERFVPFALRPTSFFQWGANLLQTQQELKVLSLLLSARHNNCAIPRRLRRDPIDAVQSSRRFNDVYGAVMRWASKQSWGRERESDALNG